MVDPPPDAGATDCAARAQRDFSSRVQPSCGPLRTSRGRNDKHGREHSRSPSRRQLRSVTVNDKPVAEHSRRSRSRQGGGGDGVVADGHYSRKKGIDPRNRTFPPAPHIQCWVVAKAHRELTLLSQSSTNFGFGGAGGGQQRHTANLEC